MGVVKCPECTKDVSSEAKSCPHCGYKKKISPMVGLSAGALFLLGLITLPIGLLFMGLGLYIIKKGNEGII